MRFISFAVLRRRIKAIKSMFNDPAVPLKKKLIIIFGLAYLISPIDLIPAPVLGFSFIDDAVLWIAILNYLKDTLDKYWDNSIDTSQSINIKKVFKGKTVIEADFSEVDENDDEDEKDKEGAAKGEEQLK